AKLFEKDIGPPPNLSEILLEANQQLMEQQIQVQREAAELRETQHTLVEQSRTDALTRALNRKAFDQELPASYTACTGERKPISALFVDADKFKSINDTHGHQAGDAVLVELARRINTAVGSDGLAYRYGGEEFAVLLPRISGERAAAIAESVRKRIEQAPFLLRGVHGAPPSLKVTVSVGVSSTDTIATLPGSPEQLIQQADQAVYAAKKGGRNCVRFFGRGETLNAPSTPATATNPVTRLNSTTSDAHAIRPSAGTSPRSKSVWIVEDDPLAAALLNATFRRVEGVEVKWFRGYKEVQAMTARIGLSTGGVTQPNVVITDLRLADGSGLDVLKAMRANPRTSDVHLIAMSASTERADQDGATKAGADSF